MPRRKTRPIRRPTALCEHCGMDYAVSRFNQRFCGSKCRMRGHYAERKAAWKLWKASS